MVEGEVIFDPMVLGHEFLHALSNENVGIMNPDDYPGAGI